MAIMGSPLREARESFEREYLKIQIRRFSGNISRTASFIGWSDRRSTASSGAGLGDSAMRNDAKMMTNRSLQDQVLHRFAGRRPGTIFMIKGVKLQGCHLVQPFSLLSPRWQAQLVTEWHLDVMPAQAPADPIWAPRGGGNGGGRSCRTVPQARPASGAMTVFISRG